MDKEEVLSRITDLGLLAVLRGPSPELTLQMVEALIKGGVLGIEITFSTPSAVEVVRELDQQFGETILVGMGTLTRPMQAAEAQSVGAKYIVSPHCDTELAKAMKDTGLAFMMGALTPSEVMLAHRLGSDVVKLFPGSLGGPAYMRALRGPFPEIRLMPTGGVKADNLRDWLAAGAFAIGAGSDLCPREWAELGLLDHITERAKAYTYAIQEARNNP